MAVPAACSGPTALSADFPPQINPQDPLNALGPSVFLNIISHMSFDSILAAETVCQGWNQTIKSHSRSIWRHACYRTGVYSDRIDKLETIEQPTTPKVEVDNSDLHLEQSMELGVDFKETCRKHVEEQRNWRYGRPKERWLTPSPMEVWRMKVDDEQGTIITTIQNPGGLVVSDLVSGLPLFLLDGISPYAHLEFAKGFVIFNSGHDLQDDHLYVYRTPPCIARSSRPGPSKTTSLRGGIEGERVAAHDGSLERGNGDLDFYRRITPPTPCRAFRARVDREGTPDERAILCTAGEEGVYVWDLDDPDHMEEIRFQVGDEIDINYVEFDETYVFICSQPQMYVFSRRTKTVVATFPHVNLTQVTGTYSQVTGSTLYRQRQRATWVPRPQGEDSCGSPSIAVRLCSSDLVANDSLLDPCIVSACHRTIGHIITGPFEDAFESISFTACHFTSGGDLLCATGHGVLMIVRDYHSVFQTDNAERLKAELEKHTLWLFFEQPIRLLTTYGCRAVITMGDEQHYYLDTSTLPSMPMAFVGDKPAIQIFDISGAHVGMDPSCLQMDRSHIYLACEVGPKDVRRADPENGRLIQLDRNITRLRARVIRTWDFTAGDRRS